ncbi:MAG TPA: UvrD-helicase domain-containing protein [Usitatibacteraceae bacterium]|nr:UvrD-helicase domain-containing protein [Usitatibacteraceae bacterium]
MSDASQIPDLVERRRALDPASSFIVQAPAGSGKTELLIQRCLVLLAIVERPEEIAAITFTRKAAAEMRSRIFAALAGARTRERPVQAHEAMTWDLARAVLERNDRLDWRLEENATRLRLQTIDSLCASLTRQMPVLARLGAQPDSIEDATPLYREAARATLALLEGGGRDADDVARVLAHLDNDAARVEGLLAGLLQRRDHWLRYLHVADQRGALEAALADVRREAVECAAARLADAGKAGPGGAGAVDAQAWIAFANELLTKKGEWRKGPPLAKELAGNVPVLESLRALQDLPPERYDDVQWEALGALVRVATLAVGHLKVAFAAHGQADFAEIAQGALAALETPEGPTDLLLALDYRIRHILVDEFQDTSLTQYQLLAKLTAGWERGDGRTLFVVGDPMQSIYRFREAEVGLFLRARHEGIGSVALAPLTLSANFRSQAGIVDWVNDAFAGVMPPREDIATGAVPYTPSHAVHDREAQAVTIHPFFNGDREGEAERVAMLARAALEEPVAEGSQPGTVAILVRARTALAAIVPALRSSGLRLRAIEIDPLPARPVVRDLLALTRALSHLADRTAWLALLRAPWCGLALAELHALAGVDPAGAAPGERAEDVTILERLHDGSRIATLPAQAQERLRRLRAVLDAALAARGRGTLRDAVEGAWLALGGPACVGEAAALGEADAFLDHLEQEEAAAQLPDIAAFEEGLAKLYAPPDEEADPRLQVMTIHKAKGLEFDTVIVPGLGGGVPPEERELFLWMERPRAGRGGGQTDLLLAPVNAAGSDRDSIHEYIRALDKRKGDLENGRLLYVAATRAKRRLHLLGDAKLGDASDPAALKGPRKGSLLAKLWPVAERVFAGESAAPPGSRGRHAPRPAAPAGIARVRLDFEVPAPPPGVTWRSPAEESRAAEPIEFSWAGETARLAGTVVHRWLQRMAEDSLQGWDAARVRALAPQLRAELRWRGILVADLDDTTARVGRALMQAVTDPKGRWVLGPHPQAAAEYRLTALVGGRRRAFVMDRVFTDAAGERWIVDYKTGTHEGAEAESFLDSERTRYAEQLHRYADALGGGPRLGLYFPLIPGWREVQA